MNNLILIKIYDARRLDNYHSDLVTPLCWVQYFFPKVHIQLASILQARSHVTIQDTHI
jgi:hypothetical protein